MMATAAIQKTMPIVLAIKPFNKLCSECDFEFVCPFSPAGIARGLTMTPPRNDATDSERLVFIETTVCGLVQRLYGNGQPGDIEKLHNKIDQEHRNTNSKIDSTNTKVAGLEKTRWKLIGAVMVVGGIPAIKELINLLHIHIG